MTRSRPISWRLGCLELQHLVDTSPVDLVGCFLDLLLSTIGVTESGLDELLGVLVEKVGMWASEHSWRS